MTFRVFGPSKLIPDMVTIMDYQRPRKNFLINTGHIHEDWERDSIVVNAGWLGGEVPIIGWDGTMKESFGVEVFDKRPCRGARQTIEIMLAEKVLLMTEEIKEFIDGTRAQYDAWKLGLLDSTDEAKKEYR